MKKAFFYLLLAIFNQSTFCAQAQEPFKYLDPIMARTEAILNTYKLQELLNEKPLNIAKIKKKFIESRINVNYAFQYYNRPKFFHPPSYLKLRVSALEIISDLKWMLSSEQLREFVDWLVTNGAALSRINNALYNGSYIGNVEAVENLIRNGANVNYISPENFSVLYITLFNPAMSRYSLHRDSCNLEIRTYKQILKVLLINGAKFRTDENFQKKLLEDYNVHEKQIFEEVLNEIAAEYAQKIVEYNIKVEKELSETAQMPNVLADIIEQYSIPQYFTNDQIIDNIISIRKTLGELDEQGGEIEQPVQAEPVAAAAAAAAQQQIPINQQAAPREAFPAAQQAASRSSRR